MRTTHKVKEYDYYDFGRIRSFNAMFNFAVGGRGIGKTYGCKKFAIRDALEKDHQFIYVRRYKDELKKAVMTFFADLQANGEFDDWDFRVNGIEAQASGIEFRDEKKREWKTIGYFIPLSTALYQKSVAYPLVRTIIFDEFIKERGPIHYLADEVTVFLNFYSTVDRGQDKTKVYFLANSVSIMNPYFLEYQIEPSDKIIKKGKLSDGTYFLVCEFIKVDKFAEAIRKTKFGQFTANTSYERFAVDNQFSDNDDHMLETKDETARYIYTLQTPRGIFSVWYNGISGNYYAQAKRPKLETHLVTEPEMMREGTRLVLRNDKLLQYLRSAFNKGMMTFDAPQTRNALIEIFKR